MLINRYILYFRTAYLLMDAMLMVVSFWLVFMARSLSSSAWTYSSNLGVFTVIFWIVFAGIFALNDPRRDESANYHLFKFFAGQVLLALSITLFLLYLKQDISRIFFTLFFLTQFILLGANRLLWLRLSRSIRQAGYNRKNVFLYGTRAEYQLLKQWTDQNKDFGYHLDGWFHRQSSTDNQNLTTEFDSIAGDDSVDHFVCDPTQLNPDLLETAVDWAEDKGARIHLIEPRTENIASRLSPRDRFGPFAAVSLRREPLTNPINITLKRIYDVIFSTLVLTLFFWWFYYMVGILIKLSSRGPVIIRQNRIGIDGLKFECMKFRTMVSDLSAEKGYAHLAKQDDSRITFIGKLLRKSNLDELPQFVNVFKGYMSVVGPRPHMVSEDHEIANKIKKYRIRRFVKPGITGWAAIHGYRGGTENMELMQKRIDYDLNYIENWTFLMDLKICIITAYQMLAFKTGAH